MKISIYKLIFNTLTLILLALSSLTAYAGDGGPYNKIVFFGDSLSDNGNLFGADFSYLPKSPPYFQGRFSNGHVWSEVAADYFRNQYRITSSNYAFGGETAILHNPIKGYLPYSLSASLDSYLFRTILRDKSTTLFVIWIGANDYLSGAKNVDKATSDVVDNIKAVIESLIYHGGKNFLIVNLPDLSKIPYAIESGATKNLYDLSTTHNAKLNTAVAQIQDEYKTVNIHLYELNKLFDDLLSRPSDFNKKYNVKIKNTTTACWSGGYTLKKKADNTVDENAIAKQFDAHLRMQAKSLRKGATDVPSNKIDRNEFAHYIATSPALREAYVITEKATNGVAPCSNPDEYIFWDHVHPTAAVHMVLSQNLINFINQYYQQAGTR